MAEEPLGGGEGGGLGLRGDRGESAQEQNEGVGGEAEWAFHAADISTGAAGGNRTRFKPA